jgi:hypothetical protein
MQELTKNMFYDEKLIQKNGDFLWVTEFIYIKKDGTENKFSYYNTYEYFPDKEKLKASNFSYYKKKYENHGR